jgi:hypothetical protein
MPYGAMEFAGGIHLSHPIPDQCLLWWFSSISSENKTMDPEIDSEILAQ